MFRDKIMFALLIIVFFTSNCKQKSIAKDDELPEFINNLVKQLKLNENPKNLCDTEIYSVFYQNQTVYVLKKNTKCANPSTTYYNSSGQIIVQAFCGVIGCMSNVPPDLEFNFTNKKVIYKFPT